MLRGVFHQFGIGILLLASTASQLAAQTTPASATTQAAATAQQASKKPSRMRTRCVVSMADIAPTTICSFIISTFASIRRRSSSVARTTIRFKMLKDDKRIQLDLYDNLKIDKIVLTRPKSKVQSPKPWLKRREADVPDLLKYERDTGAVFVDFPETLKAGRTYTIDFYYSGNPPKTGRFGGFTFSKDPMGRPWIFTACEGEGASIWWPNKDQWRDEAGVDAYQRRRTEWPD